MFVAAVMCGILSVGAAEPLMSPAPCGSALSSLSRDEAEDILNSAGEERLRRKAERDVKRKTATNAKKLRLPGKLTDCSGESDGETELFIVEGDSAGGSAVGTFNANTDGGATGHLVLISDPAEETLPYDGRTEFLSPTGDEIWLADRVEAIRGDYQSRLAAHRDEIAHHAARLGWSFMIHHTGRPAAEPLLSLTMRLQDGGSAGARSAALSKGVQ